MGGFMEQSLEYMQSFVSNDASKLSDVIQCDRR